jgi:4-alpha-glucanotransferase
MVVLQFATNRDPGNPHLLRNHVEQSVVYTGTHDNDTAVGWWARLTDAQRKTTGLAGQEPSWELIATAWRSVAALAIAPLQDVLALGSEARMNTPGTKLGNWRWRFEADALEPALAARLREVTERNRRG